MDGVVALVKVEVGEPSSSCAGTFSTEFTLGVRATTERLVLIIDFALYEGVL